MGATLSNLAYKCDTKNLNLVISEGGHELISSMLKDYVSCSNDQGIEVCVDAVCHLSTNDAVAYYIRSTEIITALIDILRQKQNDTLIYKSLRCLRHLA